MIFVTILKGKASTSGTVFVLASQNLLGSSFDHVISQIQISNVNDVMCLIVVVTRQLTWQYVIGLQYKSSCVVTETVTLSHLSSMQNYCNNNARKWQTLIVSSAIASKFLHQKGLRTWSSCSVYGSFVEIPFYIFIHCLELQFLTSLKNIYFNIYIF